MAPNKYIEKLKEKPPRKDMTFQEVKAALEGLGFYVERINGSHYYFKHSNTAIKGLVIPKPHSGSKNVLRCYIKEAQNRISLLEGEQDEER